MAVGVGDGDRAVGYVLGQAATELRGATHVALRPTGTDESRRRLREASAAVARVQERMPSGLETARRERLLADLRVCGAALDPGAG